MDYTKGSLVIEREAMIGAWLKHLGPLTKGNSLLRPVNLFDTVMDGEFYALTYNNLDAIIGDHVKPRVWTKEKNDCDNMTMKAICDIGDATDDMGYERNIALSAIAYNSLTLGTGTSRLGGYHLAGLATVWNPEVRDLFPVIVQWPFMSMSGGTTVFEHQLQDPADELEFWTGAIGF